MLYADYSYYASAYAGTIVPAAEFNEYAHRAQRFLDYITQHKISDVTEAVKTALCGATEALYEVSQQTDKIPKGIKSENNDGVSVTFADTSANSIVKQKQQCMLNAIYQALSGTGLLYRGC